MTYHMPFDECRCRGETTISSSYYSETIVCHKRETCQRYVDLNYLGERTPVVFFMCGSISGAYDFYKPEVKDDVE